MGTLGRALHNSLIPFLLASFRQLISFHSILQRVPCPLTQPLMRILKIRHGITFFNMEHVIQSARIQHSTAIVVRGRGRASLNRGCQPRPPPRLWKPSRSATSTLTWGEAQVSCHPRPVADRSAWYPGTIHKAVSQAPLRLRGRESPPPTWIPGWTRRAASRLQSPFRERAGHKLRRAPEGPRTAGHHLEPRA